MKSRLTAIADATGNSASALSLKMGQSRGFIKQCGTGCNTEAVANLLSLYPDLNPYYIIQGKGEMFIDTKASTVEAKNCLKNTEYELLFKNMRNMYENLVNENLRIRKQYEELVEENIKLIAKLHEED